MEKGIVISNKNRFVEKLPEWLTNIHSMFYYFLFLIALGVAFFATSLFVNYFTTPFTGDYTSQQFSFYTNGYDDWWHFFKTGEFVLYDTNTFLGADNIGSNSFYYLFDPFFLPILLVPRQLVPQGMAVLTIFKIAASGMTFFLYMRYLGASRTASKITGIAYAFSGWMTWYLWFNHFTEVALVFPLILLGIEIVLKEKKPWVLAASICLLGFVNYFFCICFVMCAFLYAMFRFFQRITLNTWKDNLIILACGFCAFAVGLLLPMMVVLPSAMHALTSPRASGSNYLDYLKEALKAKNLRKIFELLTSWTAISKSDQNKARVLYPFIEFVFPVTSCRGTPLTVLGNETYDNVAGSFYCFMPMLLLLVPAYMNSLKQKHFSVLVPLVFFAFALFTPLFYYLFHGFTQAYSRWTLFVTTSIMAYTGLYLDKAKDMDFKRFAISWATLVAFIVVAAVSANYIVKHYKDNFTERVPIWLAAMIDVIYLTLLVGILFLVKTKKKVSFYAFFTGFLTLEIALMGAFVIQGHGVENYINTNKGLTKNNILHSLVTKTSRWDKTYYRSYSSLASSSASNDEMRNGYNGFNFFHSIYNYNVADVCNWSSITNGVSPGSWSGNYLTKRPGLDNLLGVKYYYIENDYFRYQGRSKVSSADFRYNAPFNYVDVTDQYKTSEYKVFKNMGYIDFALSYDKVYWTDGNPAEADTYENFYSNGGKNVLAIEELYYNGMIINKYRNKGLVESIEENNPDLTVEKPVIKTKPTIRLQRYTTTRNTYYDAMLTFYDIFSGPNNKNSLSLSAKEYLDLLNTDNDTFDKYGNYPANMEGYRQWVSVIDANNGYLPNYDPKGNVYFVKASFANNYDCDIYFVDTNNEIVTYDNHNDGYYNSARNGKDYRAFYITPTYGLDENGNLTIVKDAPKIQKIIIAYRNRKVNAYPSVTIETASNYEAKNQVFNDYPITDVVSKTNKWTFKTSFEKQRAVVTRLAYEEGFSLKMTDSTGKKQKVDVFNGQGGFVSFLSGTGECSYELEFYTPYLKIGSYISMAGVLVFSSTLLGYLYIDLRKKEKGCLQFGL